MNRDDVLARIDGYRDEVIDLQRSLVALPALSPDYGQEPEVTGEARKAEFIREYLIRHGQYDHADKRDEYIGRGLVPLGIAQARLLAARLRAMPVEFTSLTSSTMTRARQTASHRLQSRHRERASR